MRVIRNTSPDLAIVDITLSGDSGLELIKGLKVLSMPVPVLVLSMHDESLYAERALRAGAKGYITKHRASGEVLSAIRHVLPGRFIFRKRWFPASCINLRRLEAKASNHASVDRLTDRELAVLELNRPRADFAGDCGLAWPRGSRRWINTAQGSRKS